MDDCISRQAAIDAVMETEPYIGTENIIYQRTDDVISNINKLPSAQPEVIRCKDCKYYRPMIDQDDLCAYRQMQVFFDDYCSRAEGREDG